MKNSEMLCQSENTDLLASLKGYLDNASPKIGEEEIVLLILRE